MKPDKVGGFLRSARASVYVAQWISVLVILNNLGVIVTSSREEPSDLPLDVNNIKGRELTHDPVKSLLLISSLDGSLTALDRHTGLLRWISKDDHDNPMIRVPSPTSKSNYSADSGSGSGGGSDENVPGDNASSVKHPHFLPDPRSGSLYLLGKRGQLKKLPFTIPQLVSMAPCKSSEGLLYTGRKIDLWLKLNPLTGEKVEIDNYDNDGEDDDPTCPVQDTTEPSVKSLLIGKSEYTISMHERKKKWNVTFHDYTSVEMTPQGIQDYDLVHFTSPSSGSIFTYEKTSGQLLWQTDTLTSPVIAIYSIDCSRSSLISLPFTSIATETLERLLKVPSAARELSPTLYIGEFPYGLYAVPSLVDDSVITISNRDTKPLLLEGPHGKDGDNDVDHSTSDSVPTPPPIIDNNDNNNDQDDILLLGHYQVPDTIKPLISHDKQITAESDDSIVKDGNNKTKTDSFEEKIPYAPKEKDNKHHHDHEIPKPTPPKSNVIFPPPPEHHRNINIESGIDYWSIILTAIIASVGTGFVILFGLYGVPRITAYFYRSETPAPRFLSGPDEINTIGKITYFSSKNSQNSKNPHLLGRGCDGTLVYKGEFEGRKVAVKRILNQYLEYAEKEIKHLKDTDQHPNVVRYFCTESDHQFTYIALKRCHATLSAWVEKGIQGFNDQRPKGEIDGLNLLREATSGLAHLHSLQIVHRDVKPANVLLIVGDKGEVKAMISDFGLCKKLANGRVSFSRNSGGITGTDGWIAPEMMGNSETERTTCSVDIFSLGCVYYYVLTRGSHPYGEPLMRQSNIICGNCSIDKILANDYNGREMLISQMISKDPEKRPPLDAILLHPIFWNSEKALNFLMDVSDRIEKETEVNFPPLGKLEQGAWRIVRENWELHICPDIFADLRVRRTYNGTAVRDLLRGLRNKKSHYRELPPHIQKILGTIPNEFLNYWISRFPLLLPHVWYIFEETRDTDTIFSKYYPDKYSFAKEYLEMYEISNVSVNVTEQVIDPASDLNWRDGARPFLQPQSQQQQQQQRLPLNSNMNLNSNNDYGNGHGGSPKHKHVLNSMLGLGNTNNTNNKEWRPNKTNKYKRNQQYQQHFMQQQQHQLNPNEFATFQQRRRSPSPSISPRPQVQPQPPF